MSGTRRKAHSPGPQVEGYRAWLAHRATHAPDGPEHAQEC